MKEVFFIPILRLKDRDAFKRTLNTNLPAAYNEWQKRLAKDIAEARRRGDTLVKVEIDYDKFLRYCSALGEKLDGKLLLEFAANEKAGGLDPDGG